MANSRQVVIYSAEHLLKARSERTRLATLAITHPGGKRFITVQGAVSEVESQQILALISKLTRAWKAKRPIKGGSRVR